MTMNLQLSLKRKWFDMTKSGEKKEDYREITPYWCAQLLLYQGSKMSKKFWTSMIPAFDHWTACFITDIGVKQFENNVMTLGYPSKDDTERILTLKHEGIEIRTGNPEWGAEPGKMYFVIKHGEIL